ncbi:ribonuclease E inhibitor RraB [Parashewanella spongiae]|uniref:Regulator of ribonuclease activity B n=1 Tax=Parashewanella spongiae TaxID=342950 RepID=A0A3A6TLU9_9GAMM|nr:ribonuclease E inhibitor RraB [Parashewanella spongiae]MCL1079740.1 ribonuclease E inhibitor RraB [Parashewanella spongiae]RJY15122.1 ribonuclease E inhibitor RraB [Parashewanella spongiae]
MSIEQQIQEQREENRLIVSELLADGSEPDAEYIIEHHFVSHNFDRLEKVAVEAFKLGYEVNDAEELELEDGRVVYCFDAVSNHRLDLELLDKACEQLLQLATKQKVEYEGWGTYFIGDDVEAEQKETLH